jgi:starch synthase/alpha-amylase
VTPLEPLENRGNGFPFTNYKAVSLNKAITEALIFYSLPDNIRHRNIRRIMQESFDQFSLSNTAKEYIHIYEELMGI